MGALIDVTILVILVGVSILGLTYKLGHKIHTHFLLPIAIFFIPLSLVYCAALMMKYF